MPSLDSAKQLLGRADAHLQELEAIVEQFRQDNADPITVDLEQEIPAGLRDVVQRDGGGKRVFVTNTPFRVADMSVPDGTAAVVHDVVQNLRVPLDYLVYELAWLDSGEIQSKTQFPIDWKAKAFRDHKTTYLTGVNPAHCYVIEQLQPYKGRPWLSTLAGLANPDKHQTLIHVQHAATLRAIDLPPIVPPAPDASGRTRVDMQLHPAAEITLVEGNRPVVEVLKEIQRSVRAVVDEFDPCFRGECRHKAPPATIGSIQHEGKKKRRRR